MAAQKFPGEFKLETFFRKYFHSIGRLLCASDTEALTMDELFEFDKSGECKRKINTLSLGYGELSGDKELLKEVAQLYPGLTSDNIMEVVPAEGIYIGLRCLAKFISDKYKQQELHAVCMFPCYQSLSEVLTLSGISVTKWCLKPCPETNEWTFSLDDLKKLLQSNTRVIVVNLPHNPTGYLPTKKWLDDLISLCRERDIFLFSDEIYRFIVHDKKESPDPTCCLYENAVTMNGLSKCFGVPGIRCGWLATRHQELLKLFVQYKSYTTICANVIGEEVAILTLKSKQDILKRQLSITKANLDHAEKFFQRHSDHFIWRRPAAGTIALVEMSEKFLHQMGSATKFCDYLITQDLLVLPSAAMLMSEDKHLRIGFGRRNFKQNLKKLEEALSKMKGKYKKI